MDTMTLYHSDIRLPEGFRLPDRVVQLEWSRHADDARFDDRYDIIPKIPVLGLSECRTVEVGMIAGRVKKLVLRVELDDDFDMILVLIPRPGRWTVKTVWLNRHNDSHKTLDRARYAR